LRSASSKLTWKFHQAIYEMERRKNEKRNHLFSCF
jgi:hypothetical protein